MILTSSTSTDIGTTIVLVVITIAVAAYLVVVNYLDHKEHIRKMELDAQHQPEPDTQDEG